MPLIGSGSSSDELGEHARIKQCFNLVGKARIFHCYRDELAWVVLLGVIMREESVQGLRDQGVVLLGVRVDERDAAVAELVVLCWGLAVQALVALADVEADALALVGRELVSEGVRDAADGDRGVEDRAGTLSQLGLLPGCSSGCHEKVHVGILEHQARALI
jgi:hypothetical protein